MNRKLGFENHRGPGLYDIKAIQKIPVQEKF